MFINYLITSLCFLLIGFFCAGYLFRRKHILTSSRSLERESNLQLALDDCKRLETEAELLRLDALEVKEALRKIFYRTHHDGINPRMKRIRGLKTIGTITRNSASMANARLMNFLEMYSKPSHQEYARLAMPESENVNMQLLEIQDILNMIESEALALEDETLRDIKKFEHLQ